jgi:aryl-alcohol dehydrogenase-like predicted oxidoreductase
VTSTIIGATNLDQLKENIAAFNIKLSDETQQKISNVIKQFPVPY